ncbi:hypothetical protein [Hoeflea sp.]|uniref:hypothetical protein n=1 Tax=Hoeflea sp. TaxID=1940281 RepID=UPI003A8E69C5
MKKTILATLAAALIASVAVPAMAAQGKGDGPRHGPRIERMMDRFDADRDGSVTFEEVSAHRLAMFESADTDKSGSLSKDELKAFGDMRKELRKQNREERRAERQSMDDGAMKDGDKMGKHGDRDGKMAGKHGGKGHGKRHGEGKGDHRGGMKLERLDTDKNGEISLEEFSSADAKMFDRFDRNGDKKIDITDFYRDRADNN